MHSDIEKYLNAKIKYRPSNREKRINDSNKPKRYQPFPRAETILIAMALSYFF